jgi:hypothetical protein
MSHLTRLAVAGSLTALVAGALLGHARMPADLATAPTPAHSATARPVPSEVPTTAQAEAWYYTHPGPSLAWRHATLVERAHARHEYAVHWDGATEGCAADLEHAYQGTTAHPAWAQPSLPVDTAAGSDLLLGEYLDGVCGE